MKKDIWIISDVHGNLRALEELIEKIKEQEDNPKICFVGDIIDRGKHSKECLQITKDYDCILGNHEDMLLRGYQEFPSKELLKKSLWYMMNYGDATLKSYKTDEELSEDIKYLKTLPLYKEYIFEDIILVVTHAPMLHQLEDLLTTNDNLNDFNNDLRESCLWNRSLPKNKLKGYFNICGHEDFINRSGFSKAPKYQKDKIIINKDLGFCAIESKEFLTALCYPSLEYIQVEK